MAIALPLAVPKAEVEVTLHELKDGLWNCDTGASIDPSSQTSATVRFLGHGWSGRSAAPGAGTRALAGPAEKEEENASEHSRH